MLDPDPCLIYSAAKTGSRGMASRMKRGNRRPSVIALAGPNGAGKSTAGPALVRDALGVTRFVDADRIARGLPSLEPARAGLAAGRVMLRRLKDLARRRVSFAFETTLSSRSFAPWIAGLLKRDYEFHLVYLWLPSADLAVERVRDRVQHGGHSVPEDVIRRRYRSGMGNVFQLYIRLATSWRMYDNSLDGPRLIAAGEGFRVIRVPDRKTWNRIEREYGNAQTASKHPQDLPGRHPDRPRHPTGRPRGLASPQAIRTTLGPLARRQGVPRLA